MQATESVVTRAGDIVQGPLEALDPTLARAFAGRIALRAEPLAGLLEELTPTPAQLIAMRAAGLAALAAALGDSIDPSLAHYVAGAFNVRLGTWQDDDPSPLALVAIPTAQAALSEGSDLSTWLAHALVEADANDRRVRYPPPPGVAQGPLGPSLSGPAAAADYAWLHSREFQVPPAELIAQPLWSTGTGETGRPELWLRWLQSHGQGDLVPTFEKARYGKLTLGDVRAELAWALAALAPDAAQVRTAPPSPAAKSGEADAVQAVAAEEQAQSAPPAAQAAPESLVPLAMFSDEPLSDERGDVLDFRPYADALAGLITNPSTATPLTLAINAPWGAGKSTLARMVRHRLERTPAERSGLPHITCWFDSWAHDDADDLTGAFVATVAQAAAAARPLWRRILFPVPKALLEPSARARRRLMQRLVILLAILTVAAVLVTGGVIEPKGWLKALTDHYGTLGSLLLVLTTALLGLREFAKAAREVGDFVRDPAAVAASGSVSAVREQIRRLIDQATRGDRRLVAFIDDLERCRPPRPVELLEVVNQLLSHPNVVTVILADMPAVAACVEIKYKELAERYHPTGPGVAAGADSRQTYGRLYLQKIVQLQFDVPPHTDDRIRALVTSLVGTDSEDAAHGGAAAARPPAGSTPGALARPGATASASGPAAPPAQPLASRVLTRLFGAPPATVAAAREIRAQAVSRLAAGEAPEQILAAISVPAPLAETAANIVRESVQRTLVDSRSGVWRIAESEALVHVPPLPRNAKRLVNRLRLLIFIAQEREMFARERDMTARRIGKWGVLCERWPELAQALALENTAIERLERHARGNPTEFSVLIQRIAPAHAQDEALLPFCRSEPALQPILAALLHMQAEPAPDPTSAAPADAPDGAAPPAQRADTVAAL